jgi:hypothetical protein
MLSTDRVLDAIEGRMTAAQIAEKLGHPSPREVVPILNELQGEGRVVRRVALEGIPVARWFRTC